MKTIPARRFLFTTAFVLIACTEAPAGTISSLIPSTGPTTGGYAITISGSGFGASGNSVTLDGNECAVFLESETMIACTAPEGTGALNDVQVVDALGNASNVRNFAYDAPEITSLEPGTGPTAGNVPLTIHGLNFGASSQDALRSVTVGTTACPLVPGASTHTRVECTLPEGQGAGQLVSVELDGQTAVTPATFDYLPPDIVTVEPSRASAAGGTIITIRGDNFGFSSSVSVDGLSCPLTGQSHSELRCVAPASSAGPSLPVVVDASGQSDSSSIEYLTPACGNGVLDEAVGEVCDDANVQDLDGCSSGCETENTEDGDQQKCIVSLNKAAAKLFKAEGKVLDYCAKEASAGVGCVGVYESKQVVAARSQVAFALSGQCSTNRPSLPIGASPDVENANTDAVIELAHDFFGADPDAALAPDATMPAKQDCQRDVTKSSLKVALTLLKSFGTCKKLGLKEETIRAPSQLGDCLATATSDAKGDKPEQKQFEAFIDSCLNAGVDPAAAFPGACAGSSAVSACLLEQVRCRVCQALNATDGTDEDCDDVDDELDNESCN